MNHLWSSVAPFPSLVPMADVCPVTTDVMELMTVMITAMSIYVAHLVSTLYTGDTFWDEQREVGLEKKKLRLCLREEVPSKIAVFSLVLQILL